MPGGKAYGVDRDYQVMCRDILLERARPTALFPLSGDGIDVAIMLGSAERTFDVVMTEDSGKLVVAECRRTKGLVKLSDIDAFARRVELLRLESGSEVAGVFFAKTGFQRGAVKAAQDAGGDAATCAQDQPVPSFALLFNRYDAVRAARFGHGEAQVQGSAKIVASVSAKIVRADGSVEELGRLG